MELYTTHSKQLLSQLRAENVKKKKKKTVIQRFISLLPLHSLHRHCLDSWSVILLYPNSFGRCLWSRSCVSPRCLLSRCLLWPTPYRATWRPWNLCSLPRSSATPAGWCRSSGDRAAWELVCRRAWRRERETPRTGSVSSQSVCGKCHRCEKWIMGGAVVC